MKYQPPLFDQLENRVLLSAGPLAIVDGYPAIDAYASANHQWDEGPYSDIRSNELFGSHVARAGGTRTGQTWSLQHELADSYRESWQLTTDTRNTAGEATFNSGSGASSNLEFTLSFELQFPTIMTWSQVGKISFSPGTNGQGGVSKYFTVEGDNYINPPTDSMIYSEDVGSGTHRFADNGTVALSRGRWDLRYAINTGSGTSQWNNIDGDFHSTRLELRVDISFESMPIPEIQAVHFAKGLTGDTNNDGLPDWAGRYVGGFEILERVSVDLNLPDEQIAFVQFGLGSPGNQGVQLHVDSSSAGGWDFSPELTNLVEDQTLTIIATTIDGESVEHTMDFYVDASGLFTGRDFTFNDKKKLYTFVFESEPVETETELAEEAFQDALEDFAVTPNTRYRAKVTTEQQEVIRVPMDWTETPYVRSGVIQATVSAFGRTLFNENYDYKPSRSSGGWSVSAEPDGGRYSLSFEGTSNLAISSGLLGAHERTKAAKIGIQVGQFKLFDRTFPLPFWAVGINVEVGVDFEIAFGAEYVTREVWTSSATPIEDFAINGTIAFAGKPYAQIAGQLSAWKILKKAVRLGIEAEGNLSVTKTFEQPLGATERAWTREVDFKVDVSALAVIAGWEFKPFKLWTYNRPSEFLENLSGVDPVWSTSFVGGSTPSLVMLEAVTLDTAPRVVVQRWAGEGWTRGTVLADDGRPKFTVHAAERNDRGRLVVAYDGLPYASSVATNRSLEQLITDTDIWYRDGNGEFIRLRTRGAGEFSPSIAFADRAGILAYRSADLVNGEWESSILVRRWKNGQWTKSTEIGDASLSSTPHAFALADGTLAVMFEAADGTNRLRALVNRVWIDLPTLGVLNERSAPFLLDGRVSVVAESGTATKPQLSLFTLDGSRWLRRRIDAALPESVISLAATQYGSEGSIAVAISGKGFREHSALAGVIEPEADTVTLVPLSTSAWDSTEISVGQIDEDLIVSFGEFPTSLDEATPPPGLAPDLDNARLASATVMLNSITELSVADISYEVVGELSNIGTSRRVGTVAVTADLVNIGVSVATVRVQARDADGDVIAAQRLWLSPGETSWTFDADFDESIGEPWSVTVLVDTGRAYAELNEQDNTLRLTTDGWFAGPSSLGGALADDEGGLYVTAVRGGVASVYERTGGIGTPFLRRTLDATNVIATDAWVDTGSGSQVYVALTDTSLYVFSGDTRVDLNEYARRRDPRITSGLDVHVADNGTAYVIGYSNDGDLLVFQGDAGSPELASWTYTNVTRDHLTPTGRSTPLFVDGTVSFTTSDGDFYVAGLTGGGKVRAIWRSGSADASWSTVNLSNLAAAPRLNGGIDISTTADGSTHLMGLSLNGQVQTLTRSPSGSWSSSNTSQVANASHIEFQPGTLHAQDLPWLARNIAGLDTDGNLVVLWQQFEGGSWNTQTLASAEPNLPTSGFVFVSTNQGEFSAIGLTANGSLSRVWWHTAQNSWQVDLI